jgi:NCAIR mutase (PurE)-related protein
MNPLDAVSRERRGCWEHEGNRGSARPMSDMTGDTTQRAHSSDDEARDVSPSAPARQQPLAVDTPGHHAPGPLVLDARLDHAREQRKGIPEIILAGVKTDEQVIRIARDFVERGGRALLTRLRPTTMDLLPREFTDCTVDLRREARAAAIHAPGYARPRTGGRIGIITAGTSDVPVAEEARLVAEEMGCEVATLYDAGVAGLHRLLGPLGEMLESGVGALVVCAGMDGALPSVVAGIAPVPVIGVPTSVGYGAGGKGRAALLSMLQTCAPGLCVVNIDNGTGAGATAALIANRLAAAQRR